MLPTSLSSRTAFTALSCSLTNRWTSPAAETGDSCLLFTCTCCPFVIMSSSLGNIGLLDNIGVFVEDLPCLHAFILALCSARYLAEMFPSEHFLNKELWSISLLQKVYYFVTCDVVMFITSVLLQHISTFNIFRHNIILCQYCHGSINSTKDGVTFLCSSLLSNFMWLSIYWFIYWGWNIS